MGRITLVGRLVLRDLRRRLFQALLLLLVISAAMAGRSAEGHSGLVGALTYYLDLRLADPATAPAFVSEHRPPAGSDPTPLTSWQSLNDAAATLVASEQQVLLPASWLLGLLAVASVAVVAGGRMAEQEKRVGLVKAAGGTPQLAAAVLLAEHLVVALVAAAAGLAAGWLAAPLLTSPGASLVGSPGSPSLTWSTVLLVTAAAVAVAAASTLVPAMRAARISTVAALAGAARVPQRRAWLIKLSARLPVPLLLGLRLVARRPRRALLSAASFAITATTIVAVLIFHSTVSQTSRLSGPFSGPPNPGNGRISEVLLVVTVVMVILAASNAMFTTWATVLDARRFSAIARSLGATPSRPWPGCRRRSCFPPWPAPCSVSPQAPHCTEPFRAEDRRGARRPGGCSP